MTPPLHPTPLSIFYAFSCLLMGLMTIGLGGFVLSRRPGAAIHRSYFLFCLATSVWLLTTCLSSSRFFPPHFTIYFGKIVYIGVAFMPTIAMQFAIVYLGDLCPPSTRAHLRIAYAATCAFAFLAVVSDQFITGYYNYSWGYFPRAGVIHYFHTAFILLTAAYIISLFLRATSAVKRAEGRSQRYHEIKFLYISFLFVTLASSDFLHNWGIDFFPVGNIFVSIFLVTITYAIFKHELLGISVAIKRSLVYSVLVTVITLIYFASVLVLSTFVGNLTHFNSLPAVVLMAVIITLVFKPLESRLRLQIDRWLFVASREQIEEENTRLREEVQKQEKLKAVATLAAGMAHEIKNPLTSIKVFADHLSDKYDDPQFRDKFVRIVQDEVDRVNNIVQQLLDFSKQREPALAPLAVTPLIEDVLTLLGDNLAKGRVEIRRDCPLDLMVIGDKLQLKQVFLNLLLNSIQAMPEGGTLTISSSKLESGWTLIRISDTGHGIDRQALPEVFNPFYSTKEGGAGLGLSIVHGIIGSHGGRVEIESEKGLGTTVSVTLRSQTPHSRAS